MIRRSTFLFHFLPGLSLLLCAILVAMAVRGFYVTERWEIAYGAERPLPPQVRSSVPMIVIGVFEILHYRGQWLVQFTPSFVRRPSLPWIRREHLPESPPRIADGIATGIWGRGHVFHIAGIRFMRDGPSMWDVGFPDALPIALTAVLPAWWLWRILSRRRHARRGLCRRCGYDLTGNNSGICPECGSPIPKSPAALYGPSLRIGSKPRRVGHDPVMKSGMMRPHDQHGR